MLNKLTRLGLAALLTLALMGLSACSKGTHGYTDPYGEWVVAEMATLYISDGLKDGDPDVTPETGPSVNGIECSEMEGSGTGRNWITKEQI